MNRKYLSKISTLSKKESTVSSWLLIDFFDTFGQNASMELTAAQIKEKFLYQNGRLVYLIPPRNNKKLEGEFADTSTDRDGYRVVYMDNKSYRAHRLIYLMHFDALPDEVDHIDGNRANNLIENLRASTHAENMRNRSTGKNNTSGKKGVYFHPNKRKYEVYVDGKLRGTYATFEWACKERDRMAKKKHGEFYKDETTEPCSKEALPGCPEIKSLQETE